MVPRWRGSADSARLTVALAADGAYIDHPFLASCGLDRRIGAADNGTGDANDHEQITQVCVSLSARGRSPLASATRYGQSGDCRAEQRAGSSTRVSVRWIGTPVAAGAGTGVAAVWPRL